jgi:hypothetical protein
MNKVRTYKRSLNSNKMQVCQMLACRTMLAEIDYGR